jgi:cell shape-determining protein MreC
MRDDRLYTTVDGEQVSLYQMVRQEPGWAAARILVAEEQSTHIAQLEAENAELKKELDSLKQRLSKTPGKLRDADQQ